MSSPRRLSVFLTAYGDRQVRDRIRVAFPSAPLLTKPTSKAEIAAAMGGRPEGAPAAT